MSVAQVCVRDVDLAETTEAIWQAAERMHQHAVGCLVVVNGRREPVGIITDRDLVERVLAQGKHPNTTLVAEVMTPDPSTITESATLKDALARMRIGQFRRLPVVDAEGKLIGLISLDDVLRVIGDEMREVTQLLEQQTPRAALAV